MEFNELKTTLKSVGFETARKEDERYLEVVVVKKQLADLVIKLDEFFGTSVWPGDQELSPEVHDVIKDYGGIMRGQTLYFWHQNGSFIFAMLWPWQDGEHTTLKVGKVER